MTNKPNRKYWPNCSVCQYMKKHPEFRHACLRSSYFDPNSMEPLNRVLERFNNPLRLPTLYRHMQRHQIKDIQRAERIAQAEGKESRTWQRNTKQTEHKRELQKVESQKVEEVLKATQEVVEGKVTLNQPHELALDTVIAIGMDRVKFSDAPVTTTHLLQAIKIKAEIERTTKDRRLEAMKAMFQGAAPKTDG